MYAKLCDGEQEYSVTVVMSSYYMKSVGICHYHVTYVCTLFQAVQRSSLNHYDKAYTRFFSILFVVFTNLQKSVDIVQTL